MKIRMIIVVSILLFVLSGCVMPSHNSDSLYSNEEVNQLQNDIRDLKSQIASLQNEEKDGIDMLLNQEEVVDSNTRIDNEHSNEDVLPSISIVHNSNVCAENKEDNYSRFNILKDGIQVAFVETSLCDSIESHIFAIKNDSVYFSLLPRGLGGYILYGKYNNLYKLNLIDNSVEEIRYSRSLMDIAVSSDLSFIAYSANSNMVVILELNNGEEKNYTLPDNMSNMQFGNFIFSPNNQKIAIAVGYGPDDERGEVYVLDLVDGTFVLYAESSAPPKIEKWLNNDEISWS